MRFIFKPTLFFIIIFSLTFIFLNALTVNGTVFIWPVNAVGAMLAMHWRYRHGNSKYIGYFTYVSLFFISHTLASLLTTQTLTIHQQLMAIAVDSIYIIIYPLSINLTLKYKCLYGTYKRCALLIYPTLITVLFQSVIAGFIFNYFITPNKIDFIIIDWFTEQLSTGMMITLFFMGAKASRRQVKNKKVARNIFGFIILMICSKLITNLSPWLVIVSTPAIPYILSIFSLSFSLVMMVTGVFLLIANISTLYFYIFFTDYNENLSHYPELFSHRIDVLLIAFLSLFISDNFNQRKKLLNKLKTQANTDKLTGLYNRHYVFSFLMKDPTKTGRTASIIIMDIDDFKKINDTYGHDYGDLVIKAVADIIKEYDVAARWGGEEFLIAIPGITKESELKKVCDDILQRVKLARIKFGTDEISFTLSAGVSMGEYKTDNELACIISRADSMLYKAKRTGKNKYYISKFEYP